MKNCDKNILVVVVVVVITIIIVVILTIMNKNTLVLHPSQPLSTLTFVRGELH